MTDRAAIALLVLAAATGLATAFWLRPRAPQVLVIGILAVAGMAAGTAVLALESGPVPTIDRVLTLLVLAVATPLHVLVVFGKPRAGALR